MVELSNYKTILFDSYWSNSLITDLLDLVYIYPWGATIFLNRCGNIITLVAGWIENSPIIYNTIVVDKSDL